jgi:diguanylate cyclase (GGDEF)-like protein/PAS domain S-box-containing protein
MLFIALSSFAQALLYLALAAYLLYKSRAVASVLYAVVCVLFAMWAWGHTCYVSAADPQTAWFWYRFATLAWIPAPFAVGHYFVALTHPAFLRRRHRVAWALWAPMVVTLYRWATAGMVLDKDIVLRRFGWAEIPDNTSPWALFATACFVVYPLASLCLVYRWGSRSARMSEKRQARTIIGTGIASIILQVVYTYSLPAIIHDCCEFSTMSPAPMVVWVFGIWYGIVRYGLMHITPAMAAGNILQTMADPLLLVDEEQRIAVLNQAAENLLAPLGKRVIGQPVREVFPDAAALLTSLGPRLGERGLRQTEIMYRQSSGREILLQCSASPVEDRHRCSTGVVLVMRDVTELKKAEGSLRHLATHDLLTDLPNRALLKDRYDQATALARRQHSFVGLLLLDLDMFKEVNDVHGHQVGDELLQAVAARLRSSVRESDTVARLGGDEFVVLLADMKRADDVLVPAERIQRALGKPLLINQHTLSIGASVGASVYPDDGDDLEMLMKYADGAMYDVKAAGRNGSRRHATSAGTRVMVESTLLLSLRQALERHEFEAWYQPLYGTQDGRIAGMEALLRWRHPELGVLAPLQFLHLAERSGLIIPIGTWILRTACAQNQAWQRQGFRQIRVAVNVSVQQLMQPDFGEIVRNALRDADLAPGHLHLEITESTAIHDTDLVKRTLVELDEIGIRIIIDDFGSGYSSMARLRTLPIHAVKIDRFFTQNVVDDPRDAAVVRAVVTVAHAMGMKVFAEGVETASQLECLRALPSAEATALSCDVVQGFLFSRPVPTDECARLFERDMG